MINWMWISPSSLFFIFWKSLQSFEKVLRRDEMRYQLCTSMIGLGGVSFSLNHLNISLTSCLRFVGTKCTKLFCARTCTRSWIKSTTMNKEEDEMLMMLMRMRRRMDGWMNWWWESSRRIWEHERKEKKHTTHKKHEQKFSHFSTAEVEYLLESFPPCEISQRRGKKKFFIIFSPRFSRLSPALVLYDTFDGGNSRKKLTLTGWMDGWIRWDEIHCLHSLPACLLQKTSPDSISSHFLGCRVKFSQLSRLSGRAGSISIGGSGSAEKSSGIISWRSRNENQQWKVSEFCWSIGFSRFLPTVERKMFANASALSHETRECSGMSNDGKSEFEKKAPLDAFSPLLVVVRR